MKKPNVKKDAKIPAKKDGKKAAKKMTSIEALKSYAKKKYSK